MALAAVVQWLLLLPSLCSARNPKRVVTGDSSSSGKARPRRRHGPAQQGPPIKGLHFWQHASFDPWAASHEHSVPPEYLGLSDAERHWMPDEEWFARRNLTQRIERLFPMIDANRDGFVDLPELEKWHHINKVFVEKARAAQSLAHHDTDGDGYVNKTEWLADTYHDVESLAEHPARAAAWHDELDDLFRDGQYRVRRPGEDAHYEPLPDDAGARARAEAQPAVHGSVHTDAAHGDGRELHEVLAGGPGRGLEGPPLDVAQHLAAVADSEEYWDQQGDAAPAGQDLGLDAGGHDEAGFPEHWDDSADVHDDRPDYFDDYELMGGHAVMSPVNCRSYSSTQSCRPGEGLYNLRGDERRWHFAALFEAADVSGDGRLDVVELRHLLNPHLSQNHALQLMALNMTIVNELAYRTRDADLVARGEVSRDDWDEVLHWLHPQKWSQYDETANVEEETKRRATDMFNSMDLDHDNKLQLIELLPIFARIYPDDARYAHMSAQDQLKRADEDLDGKIDLREMVEGLYVFYGSVDPDPHNLRYLTGAGGIHDEF